jgi:GNAT superfamily N-acetyltransferase
VFATPASLLATLTFPSDPTRGYAKTLLIFPAEPAATSTATAPDTTTAAAAGFALFYPSYSTWEAAPGIFLEDLFVRPAQRGRGYGKQLLARLAAEVVRMGGRRLEWNVLKWNAPSLAFYERVGAERRDEWVGMRVEGAALVRLAGAGGQEGGGGGG